MVKRYVFGAAAVVVTACAITVPDYPIDPGGSEGGGGPGTGGAAGTGGVVGTSSSSSGVMTSTTSSSGSMTSTTSSSSGATCGGLATGVPACDACIDTNCCSQNTACADDPACPSCLAASPPCTTDAAAAAWDNCVSQSCSSACACGTCVAALTGAPPPCSGTPAGTNYAALQSCVSTNCSSQCPSGPNDNGTCASCMSLSCMTQYQACNGS